MYPLDTHLTSGCLLMGLGTKTSASAVHAYTFSFLPVPLLVVCGRGTLGIGSLVLRVRLQLRLFSLRLGRLGHVLLVGTEHDVGAKDVSQLFEDGSALFLTLVRWLFGVSCIPPGGRRS